MEAVRFDAPRHEYRLVRTGSLLPSITQMEKRAGLIDDEFMTEEGRERGQAVHTWTAHFDLDALPPEEVDGGTSPYRGWFLAHVQATSVVRPDWQHVEVPMVNCQYGFAGRADRIGRLYRAMAIPEIKSGPHDRAHEIQTALQAMLAAPLVHLPPEAIKRYGWYLCRDGKWKLLEFKDRRDFDEARRIARRYGAGPV